MKYKNESIRRITKAPFQLRLKWTIVSPFSNHIVLTEMKRRFQCFMRNSKRTSSFILDLLPFSILWHSFWDPRQNHSECSLSLPTYLSANKFIHIMYPNKNKQNLCINDDTIVLRLSDFLLNRPWSKSGCVSM